MLVFSAISWAMAFGCVGIVCGYEKSFEDRRFSARYDACNDHARFVLNVRDDDGDCQVLCGPSGEPKLLRLKDKSVCTTANKNEPGVCVVGVCAPSPVLTEREQRPPTRRPTRPPRTTVKFVASTLPPITSGFTYSWQKWATYKPSTAASGSIGSSTQATSTTPLPGHQRGGSAKKTRIDP